MNKHNFLEVPLKAEQIHGGKGLCPHATVIRGDEFQAPIRFLNYTILPAGATYGVHAHGNDNEIYIILEGEGRYEQDGEITPIHAGDILVNAPFSSHALYNDGAGDMRVLVTEVVCQEK